MTFRDTGLRDDIIKALDDMGFEKPTPIQEQTIPFLIQNDQDLIALAQTGTGKTAAFCLPLLQKINAKDRGLQALVLCPTRELCLQIARNIEDFTKYSDHLSVLAAYGGTRVGDQIQALKQDPSVIVGTPGRVMDLVKRNKIRAEKLRFLVLDEADEMLNMGFKEELDAILDSLPRDRQTCLFSATMPKSVLHIAKEYMQSPETISTGKQNQSADKVEHHYYQVHANEKYFALQRIVDTHPDMYGIIFCRTRRETQEVAERLQKDHYNAEAIHGELTQDHRSRVMDRFRKRHLRFLVATDVAARGIDVDDITHVINFSLADTPDAYIHRSGRTGRAHSSGISISIINLRERGKIRALEKITKKTFHRKMVPSGKDACEIQLMQLIHGVSSTDIQEEKIAEYLPSIFEELKDFDREELIKRFVSLEFNRFLETYKDAKDLNAEEAPHKRKNAVKGKDWKGDYSFATVVMNLGKRDGMHIKDFFRFINQFPQLKGVELGKITLLPDDTVFEIDTNRLRDLEESLQGHIIQGKRIILSTEGSTDQEFQERPRRTHSQRGNSGNNRSGKPFRQKGGNNRGGSRGSNRGSKPGRKRR